MVRKMQGQESLDYAKEKYLDCKPAKMDEASSEGGREKEGEMSLHKMDRLGNTLWF
jgi:hypothetical protein